MITATRRCGCPPKHIFLPTPDQSRKHAEPRIESNSFDRINHTALKGSWEDSSQACCCSIQSRRPPDLAAVLSERSLPRSPKPREKPVSEIVGTGSPYKEIEAIINDNRMVLRIQKLPVEEEWDPPCDCGTGSAEENAAESKSSMTPGPYGEDVLFRKVEESSKPSSVHQERTVEPGGSCRRTITVVAHPDGESGPPGTAPVTPGSEEDRRDKREKIGRAKTPRSIDLEENPNLFVLKIRRKSETAEGRENIDLEFRTPRPWMARPRVVGKIAKPLVDTNRSVPDENIRVGDENGSGTRNSKGKNGNGKKEKKGKNGKKGKK